LIWQRLNWEASQKAGALTAARLPENRQLNRYRDVLPYDHSRIILNEGSPDYINANLVEITRLNKKYILTQGPLPHTAKHFWQMIWEQKTEAVIMLNRVVEKNQIKCYQYWPCGEEYGHVSHLEFGNFRIHYLQELRSEYFTIRSLELENILVSSCKIILICTLIHMVNCAYCVFHTTEIIEGINLFLYEVRAFFFLYLSAGIGRSGTFVMVDSILTEVEGMGDMDQIDIKAMLLEIRQYRVGLIQTPDQLRFTYLAILEGVRVLMPDVYQRAENCHTHLQTSAESGGHNSKAVAVERDKKDQEEEEETPPPLPPRQRPEVTDAPVTKKSRPNNDEPESQQELFSDSSEGSEEIINLSSLSDSEPEDGLIPKEDRDNKVFEETHLGNNSLKEKNEPSSVQTQLQQTKKVPQPENEGPSHTSETLQPTDEEELQHTEEGPRITNEGCQRTEESGPQSEHEGCCKTEKGFQSTDDRTKQTKEHLQPTDGEGIKEKDSITQIRKRRRDERKQKITELVENIKKNVKREEDAKVWRSRLKNTFIVVAVCSVAYFTFRYFTSG
ncbi:tyrosine-protein phosphatase non-receptor type 1-like, partial [Orbicella faveolata]|uniref:tyrosine-protein phosphatase non-receptor type 1-like n=1 Tax=Orbicella faveolata TaxID=48498 RepID=UPI0009E31D2E